MVEFTYTISDPMGLHARPVGLLAKLLSTKGIEAKILFSGKEADARRMYQVLGLNVKTGDTITVVVNDEVLKEEILTFFKEQNL